MPRLLALILCTGFVLILLRLERKQSTKVTPFLWIPTLWILIAASKPLAVWFPSSGATPDSSPIDRVFLIVLMIGTLLVLSKRNFQWTSTIQENPWLIVLLVFMLVSILWSSMPKTSFFRWVRELLAVLMAFLVYSEPSPRRALESILRRTAYILIPFSILLIKYFPEYGIEYGRWTGERMWIGVTLQKNSLGLLCLIAVFFLFWSIISKRRQKQVSVWKFEIHMEIFLLLLALWLLRGPSGSFFYSATSFYALTAGLLFYASLRIFRKSGINISIKVVTLLLAAILMIGIIVLFSGGSQIGFIASAAGRDTTLTGRAEIWASLLPVAMRHPLLGWGFGGFWTSSTKEIFRISGAHSGYLDVLLGLGWIGLLIVSMFFLSSARKAHRMLTRDFDWGSLVICFIFMAVIHNIAESSFDSLTSILTAVVLFFSVSSPKVINEGMSSNND